MSHKLIHYLRSERRRDGFTQDDIAALLGVPWKSRIAWYERGNLPPVETALAYQAIYGKPVSDLLGGAYDRIALAVRQRAQGLLTKTNGVNTPRGLRRKRSLLRIAE
jgi:transcriptional regulator with XRE-family HTH domain